MDNSVLLTLPMEEMLKNLRASLEENDGLFPEDFTKEDLFFLYEMGYNLYQTEEYEKAEEVFQRLVIARPDERKFWQGFASSLQMQKKYEEALSSWSMCCIIDDENPLPHYHAAECLFSMDNPEEGAKALKACQNRDKEDFFKEKIDALAQAWDISYE